MNGKQLKNSILQWAIQGKLVPQDPNDEPASALLERIRAEKVRLVKEGKIKKDKNESIIFRGDDNSHYEKFLATGEVKCIDDEIPFEIPAGWEWCRLNNLVSSISDGTHKTPNYTESGIPFLSVQNISSGVLDLSKIKYVTINEHKKLIERVHPKKNDILVCRIGTLGKALKVTWDFEFSIFVSLGLLRPVIPEIADYLVSYINSPAGFRWIQENKVGGGTHTFKINLGDFPNMLVCLPPYQEQLRIASKIGTIQPLINDYSSAQERINKLNDNIRIILKQSILQEAIQGKLVPQDPADEPASVLLGRIQEEKQRLLKEGKLKKKDITDSVIFKGDDNKYYEKIGKETICIDEEIPFSIPDSWEWVRMGVLAKLISGTSYQKDDVQSQGIRILRGGNIQNDKLVLCDDDVFLSEQYYDAEKCVQLGDTLIVASTGSPTVIGKPALIKEAISRTQIGAFLRIVRPYYFDISSYLQLLFTTSYYREHIRLKAKGTNINNIKAEYIEQMLVPLPPLSEQQRICSKIKDSTNFLA